IVAYQPCDTVVHPDYRGRGIFSGINKVRISDVKKESGDIIFNFPNENSLRGYVKMGWKNLGKVTSDVRIISPVNVIISYFSKGQVVNMEVTESYKIDLNKMDSDITDSNSGRIRIKQSREYIDWRYLQHPSRSYGIIQGYSESNLKPDFAIFTLNKSKSSIEM